VQLITKLKRNMKNKLMPLLDKLLLRKRALIECVNDQLKNISQIEHTRHRSAAKGIINIMAAVVAYTFQPKKPALALSTVTENPAERLLFAAVAVYSFVEFTLSRIDAEAKRTGMLAGSKASGQAFCNRRTQSCSCETIPRLFNPLVGCCKAGKRGNVQSFQSRSLEYHLPCVDISFGSGSEK
jgi:hypothetical protein